MELKKLKNKLDYYVDPDVMWEEIYQYYKNVKTNKNYPISHELGKMILDIGTKLGFLPKFINYCLTKGAKPLTKRGFLNYDEITMDDDVLSLNPDTNELVWSKILDIYINENYKGKLHKLKSNSGFSALVTPNHKFLTTNGYKRVEDLKISDKLRLMGTHIKDPLNETFSDEFVKLIGWSVTEGHYLYGKTETCEITIFQKEGNYCDEIRECLRSIQPKACYKEYLWNKDTKVKGFRIINDIAMMIALFAPNKVIHPDFICELSHRQRILLIDTMIKGDGHYKKDEYGEYIEGTFGSETLLTGKYAQVDKNNVDAFIMLCALSGISTKCYNNKNYSKFSNTDYYVVNMYKKPAFTRSMDSIDMNGGFIAYKENLPTVDYEGAVWCLTTEYGNFVVQYDGVVTVTGNSFKIEMIGDAQQKMVKAVCDQNFTLWKTYKCTEIKVENGRNYVIIFNETKNCWDDKKTYLKEWDVFKKYEEEFEFNSKLLLDEEGNTVKNTITIKNNPFSYFTKISYHAFVNRIKKEKKMDEVLKRYQEKIYEEMYSSGNGWENVKRQKVDDDEENMFMNTYDAHGLDAFYKNENEIDEEIIE